MNVTAGDGDDHGGMEVDGAAPQLSPAFSYFHGAGLVFLDALGTGRSIIVSLPLSRVRLNGFRTKSTVQAQCQQNWQ